MRSTSRIVTKVVKDLQDERKRRTALAIHDLAQVAEINIQFLRHLSKTGTSSKFPTNFNRQIRAGCDARISLESQFEQLLPFCCAQAPSMFAEHAQHVGTDAPATPTE